MPNNPPATAYACFVEDVGGWWSFKGIYVEQEKVLRTIEKFKHAAHCKSLVVLELPSGRQAYEHGLRSPDLGSGGN